jgi:hypothetical protein
MQGTHSGAAPPILIVGVLLEFEGNFFSYTKFWGEQNLCFNWVALRGVRSTFFFYLFAGGAVLDAAERLTLGTCAGYAAKGSDASPLPVCMSLV